MTAIEDLPTPAVLVDLAIVEGNLARMAEAARRAGVKLRPHAKTHKLLKVDCGLHRVVAPEKAAEAALRIAEAPGVRLRGLFTHAGHAHHQDLRADGSLDGRERAGGVARRARRRVEDALLRCGSRRKGRRRVARRRERDGRVRVAR